MEITYLGAGSVKLSGKSINVVTDPTTNVKADAVTLSAPAEAGFEWKRPEGAVIFDRPGEYEIKGAMVNGVPARLHIDEEGERGTVFSLKIDGVNVIVCGNVAGKLDEDEVEHLGQVDVMIVPVGGGGLTLDAEGAAAIVAQVEPGYVVPVHYDDGVTKYPVPQAGVDLFLKEMGVAPEPISKLKINSKEAPAETQVVVLTRAGS